MRKIEGGAWVEEAGCAPGGLPARRGARRTRASAHPPPSSPPLSSYVAVRGYDAVKRVLNGEHVTAEVREGGEEGEGGRRAPPPSHHQRSSLSLSPQVEWPYAIRELLGPGSVSTTYHADPITSIRHQMPPLPHSHPPP